VRFRTGAATNQAPYGIVGTGGRGQYHLMHANGVDTGKCVAACDINDENLKKAIEISKDKPQGYKDYRELLARKDVEAVIISTPLYVHFPVTRDALLAGKHVFSREEPGVQARRGPRAAGVVRGAAEAGAPGGVAAAVLGVLSDRAADDRQGHDRAGDARLRAVEPQSRLDVEAEQLAAVAADVGRADGGTGVASN
jgi:hypothetical protein